MSIFADINEVTIMGNVTQKPVVRATTNGTAVTQISVATTRSFKKGEAWEKESEFHNIVLWGKLAGMAGERLDKGTRIIVKGRLATRSWEKEGVKHWKTEIIANDVILIARYIKRDGEKQSEVQASEGDLDDMVSTQTAMGQENVDINPDDLPF
jgi:single-strand DNA-binding protein